jgi:hypothetical protein
MTIDDATRAKICEAMEATALEFVEIADQSIAGVTVNDATEVCERLVAEAVAAERERAHDVERRLTLAADSERKRAEAGEAARNALATTLVEAQSDCCLGGCYSCDEMRKVLDQYAPGWRDR